MVNVTKRGKVYQYKFEVAKIEGKRKFINRSGFKTKNEALLAGYQAYDKYINGETACKESVIVTISANTFNAILDFINVFHTIPSI